MGVGGGGCVSVSVCMCECVCMCNTPGKPVLAHIPPERDCAQTVLM